MRSAADGGQDARLQLRLPPGTLCEPQADQTFVRTANGRTANAWLSAARFRSSCISSFVNRFLARPLQKFCGSWTAVSLHLSPIGGKPTREETRGAITIAC